MSKALEDGKDVELPANPLPQLVEMLFEAGPIVRTGMGAAPLSAVELDTWSRATGSALSPWEFKTVLSLSKDYLAELNQASDIHQPPPWASKPTPDRRKALVKHIRSFLRE